MEISKGYLKVVLKFFTARFVKLQRFLRVSLIGVSLKTIRSRSGPVGPQARKKVPHSERKVGGKGLSTASGQRRGECCWRQKDPIVRISDINRSVLHPSFENQNPVLARFSKPRQKIVDLLVALLLYWGFSMNGEGVGGEATNAHDCAGPPAGDVVAEVSPTPGDKASPSETPVDTLDLLGLTSCAALSTPGEEEEDTEQERRNPGRREGG